MYATLLQRLHQLSPLSLQQQRQLCRCIQTEKVLEGSVVLLDSRSAILVPSVVNVDYTDEADLLINGIL
ncbi:hypothetical protein C1752_01735 [Acaryochloris thomasi RCC1774]|uniref:Uncharacterized protein n=1 Tax=Acaryochloris thomasi RCC1774 TaxID=1764569 RepID=A0A2W1JKZ8_9CYAN|nr:hypothetical protein [Acaryochloris thomasi]PZD74048.1 hypothetical protein C1752_01735 [Acaryochloris thomasi RCC1774]